MEIGVITYNPTYRGYNTPFITEDRAHLAANTATTLPKE